MLALGCLFRVLDEVLFHGFGGAKTHHGTPENVNSADSRQLVPLGLFELFGSQVHMAPHVHKVKHLCIADIYQRFREKCNAVGDRCEPAGKPNALPLVVPLEQIGFEYHVVDDKRDERVDWVGYYLPQHKYQL